MTNRKTGGRIIDAPELTKEFRLRELTRRRLLKSALAGSAMYAGAGLVGCSSEDPAETPADAGVMTHPDATPPPADAGQIMDASAPDTGPTTAGHLVGVGYSANTYMDALDNAFSESMDLSFIGQGDTVYFKVNCNNGDPYPHSTKPELIVELASRCKDLGASRIIVGDRSFWGDPNTFQNMERNGVSGATSQAGAELWVFDDATTDWVVIQETETPTWVGGFRLPVPVMEADHIINLPLVKTHFISSFTMCLKNVLGLIHPADRRRRGNLDVHRTPQLWSQIAEANQHLTPSLNILDGYEALITGGPTINDGAGATYAEPKVIITSADRVAADVAGVALLQDLSPSSEAVTQSAAWANPQIARAVELGLGITQPSQLDISGPTFPGIDGLITRAMMT